jgi:predicted phosphodiesterase
MMRIAIISDIHLGDPMSVMAARKGDPVSGPIELGVGYEKFKKEVKDKFAGQPLDYLVMLGDILDFSISSYKDAYDIGKVFFTRLKNDNIAREIIYVPGNHDFDLWHTVEYQVNVIKKLEKGGLPTPFRMSVPGIIDERKKGKMMDKAFTLFKVTPRVEEGQPMYAGLFLDKITGTGQDATPFNFAYPNLYLVSNDETLLITHGQYLEMYWSFLGKWVFKVINGDLKLKDPKGLNLRETVGINFPLNQLACSGVGQAAPLTQIIQQSEHDIKNNDLTKLKTYFDRLWRELKKVVKGVIPWLIFRCPLAKWWIKDKIFNSAGKMESSRYDKEFLEHPEVRERLVEFYNSMTAEINEINDEYHTDIPAPTKMIFGHTHQPIAWKNGFKIHGVPGVPHGFEMYNTGGWLNKKNENGELEFCGAEIFFYETGKPISSVRVECK